MKLRFAIDGTVFDRARAVLAERCAAPPDRRAVSDVYMDTPDDDLAANGVALRYRRRVALDAAGRARRAAAPRPWRRQELRGGGEEESLAGLGIKRLKQRLDATFAVRLERWTWRLDGGWASVSLERGEITTGPASEAFAELRVTCRRRHADEALRLAVGLGAARAVTVKVRDRGRALLRASAAGGASPG